MTVLGDDYDAVASGEAREDGDAKVFVMPDPPLDMCPVTPLGFSGRNLVFAMPEGEIRIEAAAKIGGMLAVDIFACVAGTSFLTFFRNPEDDKFMQQAAARWFVRKCREAGPWDTARAMRSLGVWLGEGDTVVLHRGEEILEISRSGKLTRLSIAAALRRAGSGALYRLRPRAPMPEGDFGPAEGQWARETLDLWRFEAIGGEGLTGADVALGWLGGAMLGAVAPFRGHLLVHALAGSGKTTFMHFLQGLMGALAGEVIDDFSEPGLRADLAGMARPVLLDEAEAQADQVGGGAAARMLELIRRMSTGKGANRKQGSMDGSGSAVTQTAVGSVAFAAINPPRLSSQDVTRIVEVRLLPLGVEGRPLASDVDIEAAGERARALAPALLRRALKASWRYRSDVQLIKSALTRSGEQPRAADLIAMLAAGRRLMLFEEALTVESAAEEAAFWRPLLDLRETQGRVENPGSDALAHLLGWDSGQHSKDRRATLGELIGRNVDKGEKGHFDDVLKAHGVATWQDPNDGTPWLLVANHHPGLERMFKNTAWPDWSRALVSLDALGPEFATRPAKPKRYGNGVKQRGIAIPLTPVLERPDRVAPTWGGGTGGGTGAVPGEEIDWEGDF